MARSKGEAGAPTGKWETAPAHLADAAEEADVRRAQPRLMVRRPGMPEVEIAIEKSEFVIGRHAAEVDLALDDELVSRRHAKLTMDARGYFRLEDLGSQNGIRFEGRPQRRLNLVDGDKFQIGKTELVFQANMTRFVTQNPARLPPARDDSQIDPPVPRATDAPPPGDLATAFGEAAEEEEDP